MGGTPRWVMVVLAAGLVLYGVAASMGWLQDPSLARSDFFGTTDISEEEAKQYRAVPFEWTVNSKSNTFRGTDKVFVHIDSSGETTVLCGWLRLVDQGASLRAARWLTEARLAAGDIKISALFIAPVDVDPGKGLKAGCARLAPGLKPAVDAPLKLEGIPVRE
jgi:hypothetical protein